MQSLNRLNRVTKKNKKGKVLPTAEQQKLISNQPSQTYKTYQYKFDVLKLKVKTLFVYEAYL